MKSVESTGGGNITLAATNNSNDDDDLVLNAQVITAGGHGNIVLDAGHDLTVNDSGLAQDVSVAGNGTITANAANVTTLATNVQLATGGGAATSITLTTDDLVIHEAAAVVLASRAPGWSRSAIRLQDRKINLGNPTAATDDLDLSEHRTEPDHGRQVDHRTQRRSESSGQRHHRRRGHDQHPIAAHHDRGQRDGQHRHRFDQRNELGDSSRCDEVTLTNAANDVTNLAIDVVSGDIQFTDASHLVIATVDGVDGIQTNSGSIHLVLDRRLADGRPTDPGKRQRPGCDD
jgi:hypothetical protein